MLLLLDCVSSETYHAYKPRQLFSAQQHLLREPRTIRDGKASSHTQQHLMENSCNHDPGDANVMASQYHCLGDVLIYG